MLRRHRQIKMQIQQLLDACLFGISFWLAWLIRSNPSVIKLFNLDPVAAFDAYFWLYVLLILAAPLVLEAQGFYDRPLLSPRRTFFWPLFKGCLITTVGLILALYFFRLQLARSVALLLGVISFGLVLLREELVRLGLKSRFARSQLQRKFVLVGTEEETSRMRRELKAVPEDGMLVLAELDLNQKSIGQLAELLHEHSVNGVILSARHSFFEQVESAIKTCELEGVEVWLIADFFRTQISHTSFDDFQGRPVLVFRSTPDASWQGVLKQVIDFGVAFASLVLCAIPFLIIALVIKLTSPGPVVFRQHRAGLNGQPFTIYKFRTMETDAEQRKQELAVLNEMSGPVFKIRMIPGSPASASCCASSAWMSSPSSSTCCAGK